MATTSTVIQTFTQPGVIRLRAADASKEAKEASTQAGSTNSAEGSTKRTGVVDGWWRGNKAGTIPAYRLGYPEFYDKTDGASLLQKRQWVKEHLVLCFRMWGDLGFGHGVSGHITVKDPILTDHYWMNPLGVHFGSMTVSKLVLVDHEGYVTEHGAQLPINQAGFSIHSAIHEARPEVNAAAHCHTQYGRAWSVFGKPLGMLNQDSCLLYDNQAIFLNGGKVAFGEQEGIEIAQSLGPTARTGILQNHGLITVGETVDETIFMYNMMEKQCEIQLMVEAAAANGMPYTEISAEDALFTGKGNNDAEALYYELQPDIEFYREKYPQACR